MRVKSLAAISLIAMTAAGCVVGAPGKDVQSAAVRSAEEAPLRADVNPGYKTGRVNIPTKPTASLEEVLTSGVPTVRAEKKEKDEEDKLRIPAMQDAALSYGARAGLAWATREINRTLEVKSGELTRTYDFQRLMIQAPNDVMVLPPVISEARDTWEAFDAGKTLRVADTVYEIVKQATFSPVAPLWQTYLISDFKEPEQVPDALAPRDESERERWREWVRQGWKKGEEQAKETFDANLARLNRDFTGMVRYRELLEEGKVAAPVLAEGNLGVTGTGRDMRVNDRAIRITRDPTLVIDSKAWGASPTTTGADGKPAGAEKPVAEPSQVAPKPRAAPKSGWGRKARPSAPVSKPAPKSFEKPSKVEEKVPAIPAAPTAKNVDGDSSGGAGRF